MLVIATWGYPGSWKRVTYRRGTSERREVKEILEKIEKEAYSFSSLSLFKKWKRSVLISITLADEDANVIGPQKAVNRLKELLERLASDKQCGDPEMRELPERVEVIAGAGTFLSNKTIKTFKTPPQNINASILLKLHKILKDSNDDLIVLDVTHGLNYHPVLVEEKLTNTILPLYALKIGREVTFAVGASDPMTGGGNCRQDVVLTYNIFAVSKHSPDLMSVIEALKVRLSSPVKHKLDEFINSKEILFALQKDFLKLSYVPSPLFWSYIFTKLSMDKVNTERTIKTIDRILEVTEELILRYRVSNGTAEATVTANEEAVKILLTLRTLLSKVKKMGEIHRLSFGATVYAIPKDKLKDLANLLKGEKRRLWDEEYSSFSNALNDLDDIRARAIEAVRQTVEDLDKAVDKVKDVKLLRKLYKINKEELMMKLCELNKFIAEALPYAFVREGKSKDPTEIALWWAVTYAEIERLSNNLSRYLRNFVAHAGMEMNMTLVFPDKKLGYYLPMLRILEDELEKTISREVRG